MEKAQDLLDKLCIMYSVYLYTKNVPEKHFQYFSCYNII